MKLQFIILCLILSSSLLVEGQILSTRYSQYSSNALMLNPAYTGSYDGTSFSALYRNKWTGIEGAPQSTVLSVHSSLDKWERIGIGGFVEYDKVGLNKWLNSFATFSYSIPTKKGMLNLGFLAGIQAHTIDVSGVFIEPIILISENTLLPNFGAGLYYYTDKWYIGSSVPYLLKEVDIYGLNITQERPLQIITTAGYVLSLNNVLGFKPTILLRVMPKATEQIQADLSGNFLIKEMYWIGLSTRFNTSNLESAILLLGIDFPKGLQIGYSYDYDLKNSRISNFYSTHEVMLGYDIAKSSKNKGPRYF